MSNKPDTERSPTVLLVEDNEDDRIVYSTILGYHGYRVLTASDGKRGIALAREKRPDVILMDVSIPVVDGWDATRTLKEDARTHTIPIIALTAHALPSDREKAFEVGCDEYLAKPAEPKLILEAVARVLAKVRAGPIN